MAIRMVRDWTRSMKVDLLTDKAERFFIRLIMKVDDYGCYYAHPGLVKADLFPLKLDSIREADISRWMAECQKAGLIVLYESEGKEYLQIVDFGQRLDKSKPKFPQPKETGNDFPETGNDFRAETETGNEKRENERESGEESPPTPPENAGKELLSESHSEDPEVKKQCLFEKRRKEFIDGLSDYVQTYGRDMINAFYRYWTEPNKSKTKMRFELQKTWDLNRRLITWSDRDKSFGKN